MQRRVVRSLPRCAPSFAHKLAADTNTVRKLITLLPTYHEPTDEEYARLSEKADAARSVIHKSVRPLCIDADGRPDQVGSCILVQIANRRFLVTAAHVLDHAYDGPLHVAADGDFVFINGTMYRSGKRETRHSDDIDVGFIEITGEIASKMGDCLFLSVDDLDVADRDQPDSVYIASGYPIRHTILNFLRRKHHAQLVTYSLSADSPAYQAFGLKQGVHLPLKFVLKRMKSWGHTRRPKKPQGISGGAIFRLNSPYSTAPLSITLVGVITEFRKSPRSILLGTRIALHLEGIAAEFEELRDSIPVNPEFKVTAKRPDAV